MATSVLLADDNPAFLESVRALLTGQGYEVVCVDNGLAVLRSLRARLFDVLVTDLVMPEREGVETILDARRDFPQLKIVAMSGDGRYVTLSENYLKVAQRAGANATLLKPFSGEELLRVLGELTRPAA